MAERGPWMLESGIAIFIVTLSSIDNFGHFRVADDVYWRPPSSILQQDRYNTVPLPFYEVHGSRLGFKFGSIYLFLSFFFFGFLISAFHEI